MSLIRVKWLIYCLSVKFEGIESYNFFQKFITNCWKEKKIQVQLTTKEIENTKALCIKFEQLLQSLNNKILSRQTHREFGDLIAQYQIAV